MCAKDDVKMEVWVRKKRMSWKLVRKIGSMVKVEFEGYEVLFLCVCVFVFVPTPLLFPTISSFRSRN